MCRAQILTIPHNGLTCGEPPEFTAYDFLKGVAQREEHPSHPEPDVAMIFRKSKHDMTVDIVEVESRLMVALQEVKCLATIIILILASMV